MNGLISRQALFWLLLALALGWFISAIHGILLPFILGVGVAYFLDPAADKLEQYGASRTMATAFITIVFFGLLALGLIALIPVLIDQTEGLIKALPGYIDRLRHWGEAMLQDYGSLLSSTQLNDATQAAQKSPKEVADAIGPLFQKLLTSGASIISLASLIVISPIVSFYLLRDWDRMIAKLDSLLPRAHAETVRDLAAQIDRILSGYVRGMLNVMFMLSAFYVIGLSFIGLNFALPIGIIGGIAIIVPYLGTVVSGGAAVGMAYMQFDSWEPVAITLAIFTAGQMLEGYVLTPKLVGDKVGLHPLWLIFGMLAGGALFGFVGILLAIPVCAVLGVLVRFAMQRYRQSELYQAKQS